MIDQAHGDETIINLIKLLTALQTKNTIKLNIDMEELIQNKMLEMH